MRATRWIVAAVVIAGCAGTADAGQPCVGCAGGQGQGFGQPDLAALSGDACFSPNGYAGHVPICGAECHDRPCCQNAWDDYCDRKARLKACGPQNGVGLPRIWCGPFFRRVECSPSSSCSEPSPSAPKREPTPSAAPVRRVPAPTIETAPMPPSAPPAPKQEAFRKPRALVVR